jgi:hypothetical protein
MIYLPFKDTMAKDILRPSKEIPQRIYDAFQKQANLRETFDSLDDAFRSEEVAVWEESKRIAREKSIPELTFEEIQLCENTARGHRDYGSKWAYAVEHKLCFKND